MQPHAECIPLELDADFSAALRIVSRKFSPYNTVWTIPVSAKELTTGVINELLTFVNSKIFTAARPFRLQKIREAIDLYIYFSRVPFHSSGLHICVTTRRAAP